MKLGALVLLSMVAGMVGCTPASRSPDAIRHDTAVATAAAARDTKAIAQGVFEGLRQKGPLNINKASAEELQTLPGIDGPAALRIVKGRPYESGADLMHRRILSRAQYGRIASRIKAK